MNANQLVQSLWWNGPKWLAYQPLCWPCNKLSQPTSIPEVKVTCNLIPISSQPVEFWNNFFSFHHLTRVLAWIRCFIYNAWNSRRKRTYDEILTSQEINQAKLHLLRLSQKQTFQDVYTALKKERGLPKGHPLAGVDVLLDKDKLLKVSTRVRKAKSPKQLKILIPLSLKSEIMRLLVTTLHQTYSHPGSLSTSLHHWRYLPYHGATQLY